MCLWAYLDDNRLEGVLDGHYEDLVPDGIEVAVYGARLVQQATARFEFDIRITQSWCGERNKHKE